MLREDQYKYVYYVNYPAQLFDLEEDPDELKDLANDPVYKDILVEFEKKLCQLVNPEKINQAAKADQQQRLEEHGGREFVLAQGPKIPYSPAPKQFR